MLFGASTIAFRNDILDRDLLSKMKAMGLESVELTDYHPHFNYQDAPRFRLLGKILADLGLHLNSLHAHLAYLDPACDLTATGPHQRTHLLDRYWRAIEAVQLMGGGILVTHDVAIPGSDDPLHTEKWHALLLNLKEIAAYTEHQNVRLVVENLGQGYHREPARLVELVEAVGHTQVGLCIDTGHRNLSGDPIEALRTAGRHLFTVHIHDNHGQRDEHLLPGQGNIDWPEVLKTLQAINYPGVFMYELSRPEDVAAVAENFRDLRTNMANRGLPNGEQKND